MQRLESSISPINVSTLRPSPLPPWASFSGAPGFIPIKRAEPKPLPAEPAPKSLLEVLLSHHWPPDGNIL